VDSISEHKIVGVVVVEVPSVLWIAPKGFDFAKPCHLFRWNSDAGTVRYRKPRCAVAMVVGEEDLLNAGDAQFCECRVEVSSTRINEKGTVPVAKNSRVDMSVMDI
jgi:hypothetical protein